MEIKIKVEKGVLPSTEFFNTAIDLVKEYSWCLDSGDALVIDGIEIRRSYSGIEITQLKPKVDVSDFRIA
jgi:hypothetical protein